MKFRSGTSQDAHFSSVIHKVIPMWRENTLFLWITYRWKGKRLGKIGTDDALAFHEIRQFFHVPHEIFVVFRGQ